MIFVCHLDMQDHESSDLLGQLSGSDDIKLYGSRYVQLILFCLVSVTNATLWITFAPITDSVETYYGVGAFGVNGQ